MTRSPQSTTREPGGSHALSGTGFRIRWDRTIIALVVLVALLTFVIAGTAALFGAGTGMAAGLALLVAVAGVVTLRALALRDRKRRRDARIEEAFSEAMGPSEPTGVGSHGSDTVFDAASTAHPAPAQRFGQASDEAAVGKAEVTSAADSVEAPEDTSSARLDVPRPTYLDAAEAHRPVPEPLAPPQVPSHQPGTRLKNGVSPEYRATVEATANRSLDLDKVLERRRAV